MSYNLECRCILITLLNREQYLDRGLHNLVEQRTRFGARKARFCDDGEFRRGTAAVLGEI
jgi:hypothetical protein